MICTVPETDSHHPRLNVFEDSKTKSLKNTCIIGAASRNTHSIGSTTFKMNAPLVNEVY